MAEKTTIAAVAFETTDARPRWLKRRATIAAVLALLVAALPMLVAPRAHAAGTVAEPDSYRTNDYRSPVPATLKGGKVIDYAAAKGLFDAKSAVFVDVYPRAPKPPNLPAGTIWRDPPHESIPGAAWLANVGYGVLPPPMQTYFSERLATLTGGDKTKPVVFFCLKNCWQSWNAAKRALEMGYTNVLWFPDGVDAWRDESQFVDTIEPVP